MYFVSCCVAAKRQLAISPEASINSAVDASATAQQQALSPSQTQGVSTCCDDVKAGEQHPLRGQLSVQLQVSLEMIPCINPGSPMMHA
jgi:hypothetical protein